MSDASHQGDGPAGSTGPGPSRRRSGGGSAVVRFSELHRARELLRTGEDIPDALRPAVTEIVSSAARRRWFGLIFVLLGVGYTITGLAAGRPAWVWVLGVAMAASGTIQFWEPQRTVVAARRLGLGPATWRG